MPDPERAKVKAPTLRGHMSMGQGQGANEGLVSRGQCLGVEVNGPMSTVKYPVVQLLEPTPIGQGLGDNAKGSEVKGPRSRGPSQWAKKGLTSCGRDKGAKAKGEMLRSRGQGAKVLGRDFKGPRLKAAKVNGRRLMGTRRRGQGRGDVGGK